MEIKQAVRFWLILSISSLKSARCQDCGGELPANPSGEIHNPDEDGDFKYDPNSECVWTITAKFDKVIEIQFYYIEIEDEITCSYDYVQVFDGKRGDWLLGKFCGTVTPESFISLSNVVTIVFKSDASENFYGFGIIYYERNGTSGLTLCGPVQLGLAGIITSVDDDLNGYYDDDVMCTWKISARNYGNKIQFYILEMAIEPTESCQHDYVKVYDAKMVFGVYCGTELPPVITSTSGDLYVDFRSDESINDKGFRAAYTVIDEDLQCGFILTQPTGQLVSTDRDNDGDYDTDLHCCWVIVAPENMEIQLDFQDFEIEDDDECLFDYIQLFDGSLAPESLLGRFCGDVKPVTTITITNVLFVEFSSDDSIVYRGFNASYKHVEDQKLCGPIQTDLAGQFDSTGQEGHCVWKIDVSRMGKLIQLYLVMTQNQSADSCDSSNIEVYDENTTFGIFCGTNETHSVTSTSSILNVDVIIGRNVTEIGFAAFYSTIDRDHRCGGILSSENGTIQSVDRDGDGKYDPNLHCVWTIVAPEESRINVEFQDFDVGKEIFSVCYFDYIKLTDGELEFEFTRGRICGNQTQPSFTSKTNVINVEFRSYEINQGKGFLLEYFFINALFLQTTRNTITTGSLVTIFTNTKTLKVWELTTTKQLAANSTMLHYVSTNDAISTLANISTKSDNLVSEKYHISSSSSFMANTRSTQKDNITTHSRDGASTSDVVTTSSAFVTTQKGMITKHSTNVTTMPDEVISSSAFMTSRSHAFSTEKDKITTHSTNVTTTSEEATSSSAFMPSKSYTFTAQKDKITTHSTNVTTAFNEVTSMTTKSYGVTSQNNNISNHLTNVSTTSDEVTLQTAYITSPSVDITNDVTTSSFDLTTGRIKQSTIRSSQKITTKAETTTNAVPERNNTTLGQTLMDKHNQTTGPHVTALSKSAAIGDLSTKNSFKVVLLLLVYVMTSLR